MSNSTSVAEQPIDTTPYHCSRPRVYRTEEEIKEIKRQVYRRYYYQNRDKILEQQKKKYHKQKQSMDKWVANSDS